MDVFELNKKYEMNNYRGFSGKISNLQIIKGNIPILLSAPHSVKHQRRNIIKKADGLTGGIVEYLSIYNDVFGLTRTFDFRDDPNYYNDGYSLKYKEEIIRIINEYAIKYLFDIHGCSNRYNFDIDIGINNYKNITNKDDVDIIVSHLSKLGKVMIDSKFNASRDEIISKYIHELTGIPCFQIEINHEIRYNKTYELLDSFNELIDDFKVKRLQK